MARFFIHECSSCRKQEAVISISTKKLDQDACTTEAIYRLNLKDLSDADYYGAVLIAIGKTRVKKDRLWSL